jgi:hypothetical protein
VSELVDDVVGPDDDIVLLKVGLRWGLRWGAAGAVRPCSRVQQGCAAAAAAASSRRAPAQRATSRHLRHPTQAQPQASGSSTHPPLTPA